MIEAIKDYKISNYSGSTVLSFLCNLTSLNIEQVNFISCQVFALFLSFVLKKWLKNSYLKLWYCLVSGVAISSFYFGHKVLHIVLSAGICFSIIRSVKTIHMPWIVFAFSMTYLSCLHLKRQFFQSVSYSLEITGPFMVLTQKVTSLAFSIRDGIDQKKTDDYKGSELQKRYALSEKPGFLEYCSFIFQFQSMLAGPLVLYKDFADFINTDKVPNPFKVVCIKLITSIFFAIIFIKLTPIFDINALRDREFLNSCSFIYIVFYITCSITLERSKYYHVWIIGDAVCNASGLGYDKIKESWDLVTNVDVIGVEFGLNFKESLGSWNKGTMKWLRHVIYDRCNNKFKTVLVFTTSAFWHGFYPGYYFTFSTYALFTLAARTVRKEVRPFFLGNRLLKAFYDFLTWLVTRFAVAYASFTFVILDFIPSIFVFMRLYGFFHIAAGGAMFILSRASKKLGILREEQSTMVSRDRLQTLREDLYGTAKS